MKVNKNISSAMNNGDSYLATTVFIQKLAEELPDYQFRYLLVGMIEARTEVIITLADSEDRKLGANQLAYVEQLNKAKTACERIM